MPSGLPDWLADLDEEDLQFIRRLVLGSGSLKALAEAYGVSYPTVRARLDRLIAKVKAAEDASPSDPFRRRIAILVADGRLAPSAARELMRAHAQTVRESEKGGKVSEQ